MFQSVCPFHELNQICIHFVLFSCNHLNEASLVHRILSIRQSSSFTMVFRSAVLALPGALALQTSHPRGDYNIKGGASMTSFPEFNVQYYYPGAASAALHGTTEANNFAAALDQVLTKQAGVIEALEKSAKRAFLVEGTGMCFS